MKRKQARSNLIKSILMLPLTVGVIVSLYFYYSFGGLTKTILFSLLFFAGLVTFVISIFKEKQKLISIIFYTYLCCVLLIAAYVGLEYSGLMEYLSTPEKIQALMGDTAPWSQIIFIFITFAQVTLVPIPSAITVFAGVYAFGVGGSILYSVIGLLIGSMFAFFLGKVFGMKIVRVTIGEGAYNKYQSIIKGKDVTMLFLMFLLPLFPDDLLCIVAGLTHMSYLQFFLMMLVTRPIGVAITAYSAKLLEVLPPTGWNLIIWAVILILVIVFAIVLMKYSNLIQDRMVDFFDKKFNKARQIKGADLTKLDLNKYHYIKDTVVYSNNAFYTSYGGRNKREAKRKAKYSK